MSGERHTRIGMVALGLVIWLVAIAWPGWSIPALLLASAMALPRRSTGC